MICARGHQAGGGRGTRPSDRTLLGFALAGACGVLGIFLWPMLLGRIYVLDDLGAYTVIARAFFRQSLEQGDPFLWWPHLDGGVYLHGLGQLGLFHPLRYLSYWLIPLPWSFSLELFLSYPLMIAGIFWLLRRWGLSRPSALVGGTFAAFSGFFLLHHVHTNAVAVATHIPWQLGMIDVLLRDGSSRRRAWAAVGITALTASQLLLHFPQVFVMSIQLEAAYWLVVGISTGTLRRSFPPLLAAKLLAISMGAVQLLPSYDYLQHTIRGETGVEFRSSLSLPPLNLLQLISPYLFTTRFYGAPGEVANTHEFALYNGAAAVALLLWVLVRIRSLGARRWMALGLLGLFLVGLDLSMGKYGFLYALQVRIPLIGLFRAPCRNILLVHLAMAGLGALAVEDLRNLLRRGERLGWQTLWPLAIPTLAGLGLALALAGVARDAETPGFASQIAVGRGIWIGPALAAGAAALIVLAARGRGWSLGLLLLFAAADQGYYGLSYAYQEAPVPYREYQTAPPGIPPPDPMYRVHGGLTRIRKKTPNIFALWGHRVINAYTGAPALVHLDYRTEKAQQVAGVQWIWRNDLPVPRVEPIPDPLPRIRLVSQVFVSPRPKAALRYVDVRTTAVVGEPVDVEEGPIGSADLVEDRPGEITVETQSATRQLLIVAEKNIPGWSVEIDDEPATPVRVYGDFLGCVVDSGRHRVHFEFEPRSLRWGKAISLSGLVAALIFHGAVFWRLGSRRKSPRP